MSDQQPRPDHHDPLPTYGTHGDDPDATLVQPSVTGSPQGASSAPRQSPVTPTQPGASEPSPQAYGQTPPYGNHSPYAPSPYAAPGQATPTAYGQPQPGGQYVQGQYAQQPAPYGYGQAQPQWTPQPEPRRGKGLGVTGLLGAIIANVIGVVSGLGFGRLYGDFLVNSGIDPAELQGDPSAMANDPRFQALAEQTGGSILGLGAATVIGLIALVISIIAIARKSGRGFGVLGLILAIAGPLLVLGAMMLGLMPYLQALA